MQIQFNLFSLCCCFFFILSPLSKLSIRYKDTKSTYCWRYLICWNGFAGAWAYSVDEILLKDSWNSLIVSEERENEHIHSFIDVKTNNKKPTPRSWSVSFLFYGRVLHEIPISCTIYTWTSLVRINGSSFCCKDSIVEKTDDIFIQVEAFDRTSDSGACKPRKRSWITAGGGQLTVNLVIFTYQNAYPSYNLIWFAQAFVHVIEHITDSLLYKLFIVRCKQVHLLYYNDNGLNSMPATNIN